MGFFILLIQLFIIINRRKFYYFLPSSSLFTIPGISWSSRLLVLVSVSVFCIAAMLIWGFPSLLASLFVVKVLLLFLPRSGCK